MLCAPLPRLSLSLAAADARRPLAARGSALYFSLLHLSKLDSMYCFSLSVRLLIDSTGNLAVWLCKT